MARNVRWKQREALGPIEIEEPYSITWNANDWPIYIKCPFASETNYLTTIIQEGWQWKRPPQIILCIISQYNALQWENELLISRFKEGLVKAASAARMWIVTNGLDVGASKMIGEAIQNEIKWTKAINHTSALLQARCIGVIRDDRITSDPLMQRDLKDIEKLNETNPLHQGRDKFKEGKFYIDSNHSYFIFVTKEEDSDLEQLLALDLFSELSNGAVWQRDKVDKTGKISKENLAKKETDEKGKHGISFGSNIPLIAIVIEGDKDSGTVVLQYLQNQIPVVVLWGTGGIADLIAVAYTEINDRKKQEGLWDPDFFECILNPMLSRKIVLMYPHLRDKLSEVRNLRDKVVECVRSSTQEGIEYLTILNIHSSRLDLRKLDQYLLESYFKSRQIPENTAIKPQELLTLDLGLTLNWNNPLIARNLLLKRLGSERVTIANELFLRALTESGREEFVEIFLRSGFQVRRLYNHTCIKWLIKEATKVDFFQIVCCEGLLGISVTVGFPLDDFLSPTNHLILLTSGLGDFLKQDDLTNRNRAKPNCIEQKSLAFLTLWAVFINNLKLVNKLLFFHNQPINLCLTVATTLRKMSNFISDISLQKKMETSAVEFGELATKLLDEYYENSPVRARLALKLQSPHWSYQSASDVAVAAEVHKFVAHASCQKLLTNQFLNDMHIKQSPYGELGIPVGIKILICAILIFPINFWLDFPHHVAEKKKKMKAIYKKAAKELKTEEKGDSSYEFMQKHKAIENKEISKNEADPKKSEENLDPEAKNLAEKKQTLLELKKYKISDIKFIEKFFIFWAAAITKYWLHHFSYLVFLFLFTIDVIQPSCGDRQLDIFIFLWIIAMLIEDVRRTYILLQKYSSTHVDFAYIEIPAIILFLCVFYMGRIIHFGPLVYNQYIVRMFMCCTLFYYYIRYLAIFIPISATFGPLFFRLKLMALNDYIQYMLMIAPIMIGSAIVIRVSQFPDETFMSPSAFHKMFHNTFYTLFKMFDDDMFERDTCAAKRVNTSSLVTYCRPQGDYIDPKCNNYGFWPYAFNIAFLVLMKMIVSNLMYALFNNSLAALDALTIWKFQRFQTITEFNFCMPLPPPLSFICYIYYFLKYLLCICCRCCNRENKQLEDIYICHGCPDTTTICFSRVVCDNVLRRKNEKEKSDAALSELFNRSLVTTNEIEFTKMQVIKLRRTVTSLHRMIFNLQTDATATKLKIERHELSRTSPYLFSQVERNTVSDKYVPWDVVWPEYDPTVYTQLKSSFPVEVNADDDMTAEIKDKKAPLMLKKQFKFNEVFIDASAIYDRRSWIKDNRNKAITYKSDGISPLNPNGRTGLAGRGALPRWGPNHHIAVLITKYSTVATQTFEAILRPKNILDTAEYNLIGGFIPNEDLYEIVRKQVDPQSKTEWKTCEDMIDFFTKQVKTDNETAERKIIETTKEEVKQETNIAKLFVPAIDFKLETEEIFKPGLQKIGQMVNKKGLQYRKVLTGYLDSPYNTDNAWKEVEFWHFHYTTECALNAKNDFNWITVQEDIRGKISPEEYNLISHCISYLKK